MDLQTRIKMANVENARLMREAREAQTAHYYAHGYKLGIRAEEQPSYLWDACMVVLGLTGALGVVWMAIQSVLS